MPSPTCLLPLLGLFFIAIARVSASTFVVTNTSDSGPGSLRQAITDANTHPNSAGVDNIQFNISGAGVHTITLASALPDLTEGMMLDGWSQPGFQNAPLIELTAQQGVVADGFRIIGGSTTIRGLVINGFRGDSARAGIYVGPKGGNTIDGCYIGTDKTGTQSVPNDYGVIVKQLGLTVIGGVRNIISGNSFSGIWVEQFDFNSVETETVRITRNYIGTDVTGTLAVPNGTATLNGATVVAAVIVSCRYGMIGGTHFGEGNVVSGNTTTGIYAGGVNSLVGGNLIGTTAYGTSALPNSRAGVTGTATIGGTLFAARNLISGNTGYGVVLSSLDTVVQGNFIGTAISGDYAVPNYGGVLVIGGSHNLIGGSAFNAGNLISGNLHSGIHFAHASNFGINGPYSIPPTDNIVQGNLIGTDRTGSGSLGNGDDGILFEAAGPSSYPTFPALRNLIGGTLASARNVISRNQGNGIQMAGQSSFTRILGNFIGIAADGVSSLGNLKNGILTSTSSSYLGVGPSLEAGNTIAFNELNGISVTGTTQRISANSIHHNFLLGIDLGDNGATPNDPGDADSGANDLQNFPVITAAFGFNGNLTIYGSINSTPSKAFTLEFFANLADPFMFGNKGTVFLGQAQVTTNSSGDAAFNVTFPLPPEVESVAATAIAPAGPAEGNTSEFSTAVTVVPTAPAPPPTSPTTVVLATHASQLLNLSTRLRVETGDGVLIGGFIISPPDDKKIIVRGLGPSLGSFNLPGFLADPFLELHATTGPLLAQNDNWKENQRTEIENSGLAPTNDLESAIVQTGAGKHYTAVLKGNNNTTGIGLVEVYDLDQAAKSNLANVSTRGFVGNGDNVMIAGFIVGGTGRGTTTVAIRGLGPSLASFGISNFLADPTLELRNGDGTLVQSNNEWRDSENFYGIRATSLQPEFAQEAMILYDVTPGNYTAILRGASNGTGIGLLEVYNLR